MRHFQTIAVALLLLSFLNISRADSACGSINSTDATAAMAKDIWLNGYCDGFLPCKQVLGLFHGCKDAESFLSKLGAREGAPLTESQVQSALLLTTGKKSGIAECLWRFDAEQCKRYLGGSTATTEDSVTVVAEPVRKPMTAGLARVERQRVSDMDSRAEQIISRSCGSWGCGDLLERTVDPVIREVEVLNANSEYRAQLPAYEPIAAIAAAARLGWVRNNGRWEQNAAVSPVTKIGGVSAADCQQVHDRLASAIGINPAQEPTELAFFEAECITLSPEYPVAVREWRLRLGAAVTSVGTTNGPVSRNSAMIVAKEIPTESLSHLDNWNTVALSDQQRIEDAITSEKKRLEDEKNKELEAQHTAEEARLAGGNISGGEAVFDRTPRYRTIGVGPMFVSDVKGYLTALDKVLDMPCASSFKNTADQLTMSSLQYIEKKLKGEDYDRDVEWKQRMDLSNAVMGSLQSCNDSPDVRVVRQRFINIYQDAAAHYTHLDSNASTSAASSSPDKGHAQCKAKLDEIGQRVSRYTAAHSDSASGLMKVVMWADQEGIRLVESTCPNDPEYGKQLGELRTHLEQTGLSCGQLVSSGSCSPMAPD